MIELIIQLLIAFLFGIFGFTSASQSSVAPVFEATAEAAAPGGDLVVSGILTVVENVDALLLESFPVQIHLHVTGYQPDGCNVPVQVVQQRDGNNVTVRIFRQVPIDVMCPMNIVPYDETIPLEGGFEPGTYTIDVNGVTIDVQI
jgi:hypothetical protein